MNMLQFHVRSVNLVKPVIVDIGDYHLVVGDATHWLEALAQVQHVTVFWHRYSVPPRVFAHTHVDEENLNRVKIIMRQFFIITQNFDSILPQSPASLHRAEAECCRCRIQFLS